MSFIRYLIHEYPTGVLGRTAVWRFHIRNLSNNALAVIVTYVTVGDSELWPWLHCDGEQMGTVTVHACLSLHPQNILDPSNNDTGTRPLHKEQHMETKSVPRKVLI
jgi:hypothetical protein